MNRNCGASPAGNILRRESGYGPITAGGLPRVNKGGKTAWEGSWGAREDHQAGSATPRPGGGHRTIIPEGQAAVKISTERQVTIGKYPGR